MNISAMKQALEALELVDKDIEWHDKSPTRKFCNQAAHFLRQAIEQAEKQEPEAWAEITKEYTAISSDPFENAIPLYTAPPKREWVGLTEDEKQFFKAMGFSGIDIVEAKLKEKNT